jgi:uncharacterized protein
MMMNKPLWMRRISSLGIVGLVILFCLAPVHGSEVPALKGRVNDYAGILSPAAESRLETVLGDLERTDATQIVVLTLPSLGGETIEEYGIRIADAWKIGQKGLDNGAILIISKNDRKLRIEVGYGLEGTLTDLRAGRIIGNIIVPRFKAGDFEQGITEGVQAMIQVVRGEFKAENRPAPSAVPWHENLFSIILVLFLINIMGRIRKPMGALAGAGLFPALGALFFNPGPFWTLVMIPVGALGGLAMSFFGPPIRSGPASFISRHGDGFRLGGGRSLGGGSFGGFGGFSGGGGGFGGGGASGGW